MFFKRITFDNMIMGGQACIRGIRIPASLIVNLVANGMPKEEIIQQYPDIEQADIEEALHYCLVNLMMLHIVLSSRRSTRLRDLKIPHSSLE